MSISSLLNHDLKYQKSSSECKIEEKSIKNENIFENISTDREEKKDPKSLIKLADEIGKEIENKFFPNFKIGFSDPETKDIPETSNKLSLKDSQEIRSIITEEDINKPSWSIQDILGLTQKVNENNNLNKDSKIQKMKNIENKLNDFIDISTNYFKNKQISNNLLPASTHFDQKLRTSLISGKYMCINYRLQRHSEITL